MTQAAQPTDTGKLKRKDLFYKAENRLFHAKTVENKATGVVIKMTNNLEKLYAYMLNQYKWYKKNKRPFAESQVRLGTAARIGDPVKNTKRYMDELIALGLVTILVKSKQPKVCDVYKVFEVDEVAKNLAFTYPTFEGKPLYDHEVRLSKGKQSATQAAQQAAPQAQQEQHPLADADEPAPDEEVSPDVVPDKPITETESDTPENNPANIEFFDSNDVVTEAFIKLTDANRYDDGTLKNFRYVYWLARQAQDEQNGVPVRTKEQYMGEAQSWHVPPHVLPKGTSEPVHEAEPNEDANF